MLCVVIITTCLKVLSLDVLRPKEIIFNQKLSLARLQNSVGTNLRAPAGGGICERGVIRSRLLGRASKLWPDQFIALTDNLIILSHILTI